MIPYVTFRETDSKGDLVYYILQKEFPHYKALISDKPVDYIVTSIPVSDYNLYLVFSGTLRGNFIPSYQNVDKDITEVLMDMANWFYENRILIEPKKYKKWKV